MSRGTHRLSIALLLGGVAVVGSAPAAQQPAVEVAPPPRVKRQSEADIQRLIARVGSPQYQEREAATAALQRLPEAVGPVTRALAAADSPEVSRRLTAVLATLKRDWANRRLAKLPEYAKNRQFDRLVETMVACREYLTEKHDAPVREFLKGVYADATGGKEHRPTSGKYWIDFGTFAWSHRPGHTPYNGRVTKIDLTARVGGLNMNAVATDLVGAADPNARQPDGFMQSVILCNGDVHGYAVGGGMIIATGRVRIWGIVGRAVVVSLSGVEAAVFDTSVVVSRGRVEGKGDDGDNIVRASDAIFFRGWKMYSADDTGGELLSVFGAVMVRHVAPASPFGLTGVQVGDVLTQVDGTPVRSVRDAHRLLCRAAVGRGDAALGLVRGGRPVSTVAALEVWE